MSLRKSATAFLGLHIVTAIFSIVGAWAFYNLPQIPDWDYATITLWLGIVNVISGVLVAFLCMVSQQGWRSALLLLATCTLIAGGMELLGTTTGFPFGAYRYTELLGPKFLGHVPYLIPLSWLMMLYPAMVLTEAVSVKGWLRPVTAGTILTIWDFAMDPAVTTGFAYWEWQSAQGGFYGMPYTNWLGWWLTGSLVAGIFWKLKPNERFRWHVLAVALYLTQGAFMAGLALVYMRWLSTLLWAVATAGVMYAVWSRYHMNPEDLKEG